MNLDSCTPDQRKIITCVQGPLLVSAGAGSGKTFTLTQRIAYALLPESGPAVDDIDEVLAITFTEKAAAEIKARVKRTLRAEGLGEEALKVDGAWISTIHGMCARILRAHAFDLGIDPAFGIIGDAERADLVAESINDALGQDNDIIERGSYAALFDEFPARSAFPGATSVASLLQTLMDKAVGLRDGLDALDFGPPPTDPAALARELLVAYEEVLPAVEQGAGSAAAERAHVQAMQAAQLLEAFLARAEHPSAVGSPLSRAAAPGGGSFDLEELAGVVEHCAYVPKTFGNAGVKAQIAAYQQVHAHVCREIALGLAWPRTFDLMALARDVSRRYEAKKRERRTLDNDDLLVKTRAALVGHPEVARRYENRFKLVMVDEFQDTSQLQIDLVSRLAGAQCARLCTVGDAQQSIYRFRGADVNVYEEHKRTMRAPKTDALYVELRKNFRSHADVLSFVDRIFGQPQVFGEGFMSLAPHEGRASRYRGGGPRIDLVLSLCPSGRNTGVGIREAKRASARAVAQRFAALREQGHPPRDMVVLLGKMACADIYAQELRAVGFECAVTGGSLFASAPEVRVIGRLVEVLANPAHTAALFEVLTSDLVHLSADDLLELASDVDPETKEIRRRDLDRGFARLSEDASSLPPRLAHAVNLITWACGQMRTQALSQVVQDVVVRSGWLSRLEEQGAVGLACAANVLKAVRLIERLEKERQGGPAQTARAFARELAAGIKEAPGALSGSGGDVVKIMTIHASKGLEFPIVALADFAGSASRSGKLVVETIGDAARASLAPGNALEGFPALRKRASGTLADAGGADLAAAHCLLQAGGASRDERGSARCTQDAYRTALRERAEHEELAEERRKLYVGLTRASEALIVAMDAKAPAQGKPPSYPQAVDDVRSALCGESDFPEGAGALAYGGSEPARFERIVVQAAESEGAPDAPGDGAAATRFAVPRMADSAAMPCRPWSGLREHVFSYSSIAPVSQGDRHAPADPAPQEPSQAAAARNGGGPEALSVNDEGARTASSDAEKATGLGSAFHRAAQYAVETGHVPDQARLKALADALMLSFEQRGRLAAACERWFASATYAETLSWPHRRAETPFFVAIEEEYLEGEIDLLCTRAAEPGGSALVIDYKTGGVDGACPDVLFAKHLLQAQCYAFALLSQGFDEVELRFVRVEHAQGAQPQAVEYHFSSQNLDELKACIVTARRAARP